MSDKVRDLGGLADGLSRRRLLQLGMVTAGAATIAGCTTDGSPGEDPRVAQGDEAPSLKAKVDSGELPPVAERLPTNPMVVTPVESVGIYGGVWQAWEYQSMAGVRAPYRSAGYEPLVRWDTAFTEVVPNLAEKWEVSDGGLSYTFHLREGVKWSDGKPLTSADIEFAYNDVMRNTDLFPVLKGPFRPGGTPAEFTVIDDLTFSFDFAEPTGQFLGRLASANVGALLTSCQKDYFAKLHVEHNPDVAETAKSEGFDDWADWFAAQGGAGANTVDYWRPDVPTLFAWRTTKPLGTGSEIVLERNPYYWKVDTDGRQLPYLDGVHYTFTANTEVAVLKATSGEFNLVEPKFNDGFCTLTNKPILAKSRESAGYDFISGQSTRMNQMMINLNLTTVDKSKRELYRNKDFRIGLSHAIDRPDLIEAVFQGQGKPWQGAPRPDSWVVNEQLATQYTEFSTDKANEHLDRAGLTGRDSDGFRTDGNGKRVTIACEVATNQPSMVSSLELIKGYWAEVGIDLAIKAESRELMQSRLIANEVDVSVWGGDGGASYEAMYDPRYYVPWFGGARWAPEWGKWYATNGKSGQEPIDSVKDQLKLFDELKAEPDVERQTTIFSEILAIAAEQFYVIGTVLPEGKYGIVGTDFTNVPEGMWTSSLYVSPGATNPEQYYIAQQ